MKDALLKLMDKELDNFIYAAMAMVLVGIVAYFELDGTQATMAGSLFGAFLIKIKGA